MNRLSNFGDFALTKAEMKSVVGGTCYAMCWTGGAPKRGNTMGPPIEGNMAKVKDHAKDCNGAWCCASCGQGKFSWCKNC